MQFGIILTSYRQPEYLKQAILSVFAQTYSKSFQLIVVNDSDEKSCIQMELPDRPEIDMIYIDNKKNLGVQRSYNLGCLHLNDDITWVIRLDGDDQLLSNALTDLEEFLNIHDNKKLGFVYSNLKLMGSEKIRQYPEWKDGSIQSLQNIGHLQAIKKSVADEIGHFDITLKYSHDTDQIIRVIEKGYQIKHIPKVLYYNRLHPEQYTVKFAQNNDPQFWKNLIYQRALQKRPDLWVESRQQVIMQTSGSHLWKSETIFINNFLKTKENMLNGLDLGCSNRKKISYCVGIDKDRCGGKTPEIVWDGTKELPFRDETLDFICGSHIIEHIENPIQAIENWLKKLRSGGMLLLIVPHKKFIPNIGTPDGDPTHVADYLPQDFAEKVLDKLPLKCCKLLSFDKINNNWSFDVFLEKI